MKKKLFINFFILSLMFFFLFNSFGLNYLFFTCLRRNTTITINIWNKLQGTNLTLIKWLYEPKSFFKKNTFSKTTSKIN